MPVFVMDKTYSDGNVLTEQNLDDMKDSTETFINTTRLDSDNLQDDGIDPEKLNATVTDGATLTRDGTTKRLQVANGGIGLTQLAAGVLNVLVPTGSILPFGGTSAPSAEFLVCNGAAVSRVTYANLFTVLSTRYGVGDGLTTFNLPDFRGAFLRGWDNGRGLDQDRASRTASGTGGATGDNIGSFQGHAFQTHNHTQNSHNHTQSSHTHTGTTDGHVHTVRGTSRDSGSATGIRNGTSYGFSGNQDTNDIGTITAVPGGSGNYLSTATDDFTTDSRTAVNIATTATNNSASSSGSFDQASSAETRPINIYVNYIIKI